MGYLNHISKALAYVTEKIIAGIFILMLIAIILQVVFRYVFSMPLGWTEELSRYLMTWLVFLGASVASKNREHLGITLVQEYAPEKLKVILNLFLEVIVCVFLAVVVWYAFELTSEVHKTASPTLQIPMSIPYYSVVIGGLLMFIHACINIIRDLRQLFSHSS